MINRPRHLLLVLFTGVFAAGLCSARADDVDTVKEKLFQTKKDYDAEVQKFKKAVSEMLDKREEDARKAGNKKLLDQVKAEREAFDKSGESPPTIPNTIREPLTAARTKVDKAYAAAIKEYVRLKQDDAASATEKEQQESQVSSAILFGKRTFLTTLKHFDVKVWDNTFANNGTYRTFDSGGTIKVKMNGEYVPNSIFLIPQVNDSSQVRYPLGGKWTVFRAAIGIPKVSDKQGDPSTPLTFEVLGDDKSLWKSEPVTKMETYQTCTINVEKVKTLTLRVHCPGHNGWAASYWFEPILVE
jgi:hypothetical protein